MKKKNFLIYTLSLLFFHSCAYEPIYKEKTLFSNKINIVVKSKDYDKKGPNLMKMSLNKKLNAKKSKPSNLKLVVSLDRSISSLGFSKDLYTTGKMVVYNISYTFYDKKGILVTGKLNNKSSFFVGSNPYANLISEEQADKNLIYLLSDNLSNIILASNFSRDIVP